MSWPRLETAAAAAAATTWVRRRHGDGGGAARGPGVRAAVVPQNHVYANLYVVKNVERLFDITTYGLGFLNHPRVYVVLCLKVLR